ncbi:MAG: hypothetical protein QXH21_08170 [Ignisphaera sp.]
MSTKARESKFSYNFEQEVVEKLNRIQNLLAMVVEKLELIDEKLTAAEKKGGYKRKGGRYRIVVNQRGKEGRAEGKNIIEILMKQGVVFESDLKNMRTKEKLIEHLRSKGIVVIEGQKERVLVTKEYLNSFMSVLNNCRGPGEAEEKIKDEKQIRLYRFLRDSGLLVYDSRSGWVLQT